jgi:hypothetical protein
MCEVQFRGERFDNDEWTCSCCKYWNEGKCELLGGNSYWYGFCDGYVKKKSKKMGKVNLLNWRVSSNEDSY